MRGGVPIGADRDPLDVLIPQTRSKSWPFFGRGPASMPIYRLRPRRSRGGRHNHPPALTRTPLTLRYQILWFNMDSKLTKPREKQGPHIVASVRTKVLCDVLHKIGRHLEAG
jgi:hypothetical protein